MELRQLRYFLSVADTRSFVSAAGKLFISRQAVSKAISQLESELGVELFMRDSNGAFLTPVGIMFYERVRVLVMELENLRDDVQRCGTRFYQRIRLAFSTGVMRIFEPKLLEWRNAQENMDIHYQECPEDTCMQLLRDDKVDMVISTAPEKDPLFSAVKVMEAPIGVLIQERHDLSQLPEVSCADLSDVPVAIHTDYFSQEFCQKFFITPQYQGLDFHRLFLLTKDGLCALLLPRCLAAGTEEGLKWIPVLDAPAWALYKIYPKMAEKNQLYSTALDELHISIFQEMK